MFWNHRRPANQLPVPAAAPSMVARRVVLSLPFLLALPALLALAACQSPRAGSHGGLRLEVHAIPASPDLAEARRFLAEAVLVNTGRAPVLIEWKGGLRSDAELFAPDGALLHRWSDDQAGAGEPGVLLLNPGERAFFEMVMPTRGMTPGEPHKLVARLSGSRPLEARATITPQKTSP